MSAIAERCLAYQEFKAAQSLFGKAPRLLDAAERDRVRRVAVRQYAIETRVLESPEARGVCVPEATVDAARREIRARYAEASEYLADLEANGLNEAGLADALRRDLAVEAVLERVSARAERVTDTDLEIFYHVNRERFVLPERRTARQILITINDQFAENARPAALARIREIRDHVLRDPQRFADQALQHSECPTALQGGMLGEYVRGQMFPELEAGLFALAEGSVSEVIESHLGFHLLRCEAIVPETVAAFSLVAPRIREILQSQRARACQRAWIKQLFAPAAAQAPRPGVAHGNDGR
jgi:peptidyl-prolyl cis-trans isomerase C